jgi:hypothetical protein
MRNFLGYHMCMRKFLFWITFKMPRKTKRQQQVSKILRKKGHYIFKSQEETEIETVKNEVQIENEVIKDWIEGENIND